MSVTPPPLEISEPSVHRMKNVHILAKVDIPLYMVKVINDRFILVAGGGGSANTGVKNAVEIYELLPCLGDKYNPCKAKLVNRYYTENRAIMSGSVFRDEGHHVLAGGGINGECILYKMRPIINRDAGYSNGNIPGSHRGSTSASHNLTVRRRRTSSSCSNDGEPHSNRLFSNNFDDGRNNHRDSIHEASEVSQDHQVNLSRNAATMNGDLSISYELSQISSFKTDFHNEKHEEPFVKVIRYNHTSSVMIAGGADGHIRVWTYPDIRLLVDINAHQDEIDDLDINQSGTMIVSASRDGCSYIWDSSNGKMVKKLVCELPVIKNSPKPIKYLIRACRFGISATSSKYHLYTIHNPAIREKPPRAALICSWNTNNFNVENIASLGPIVVSSMAISDDGRYIGIGTQDGIVNVHSSSSLQRIYTSPKAHNIFVTGLEFLYSTPECRRLTGNSQCSLISISVDRRIVIHNIPHYKPKGILSHTIFLLLIIFSMFYLIEYFDFQLKR